MKVLVPTSVFKRRFGILADLSPFAVMKSNLKPKRLLRSNFLGDWNLKVHQIGASVREVDRIVLASLQLTQASARTPRSTVTIAVAAIREDMLFKFGYGFATCSFPNNGLRPDPRLFQKAVCFGNATIAPNCNKLINGLRVPIARGFWNVVSERVTFFTIWCGLSIVARSGTQ
jgi:hypothetical protein